MGVFFTFGLKWVQDTQFFQIFFQIQKVHVQTIILGGFLEGHVAIAKNKNFFFCFLGGRVSNFAK